MSKIDDLRNQLNNFQVSLNQIQTTVNSLTFKTLTDYTNDELFTELLRRLRITDFKPVSDKKVDFDDVKTTEVENPRSINFPVGEIHRSPGYVYVKLADGRVSTNGQIAAGYYVQRYSNDADGWKIIDKLKENSSLRYIYRCPRIPYKLARAGFCGVKKKYAKVVDVYFK